MAGLEVLGSFKVFLRQIDAESSPAGVYVTSSYDGFKIKSKGDHMAYTLPVDHKVEVKVEYVDSKGNPAQVEGNPRWESGNASVITVAADTSDPFKAVITPVGPVATGQVRVTADADLGQGVKEIITLLDVAVVAGEAVAGTITPTGEPTPAQGQQGYQQRGAGTAPPQAQAQRHPQAQPKR